MKNLLSTIFIFSLLGISSYAAEITKVVGQKALINLSGSDAQVGDQFYAVTAEGKKVGILEVTKVSNGKAIANITKGTAAAGQSVNPKAGGGSQSSKPQNTETTEAADTSDHRSHDEATTTSKKSRKKTSGGFLLGMGSHSFSMDIGPTIPRDAASMTGTSMSAKGFGDYDLSSSLTIRAAAGLETFSTKGTIANTYCDNNTSKECSLSFQYFALEGSGHFNYMTGKTRGWIGLGYSFLFQMSASHNIPNLQTSSTNNMVLVSGGFDIGLGKGHFIPLVAEYGLFPGSTDVKASSLFLRAGYGFPF